MLNQVKSSWIQYQRLKAKRNKSAKLDFIKIKSFCTSKDIIKKMQGQTTDLEKVCAYDIAFAKGLLPRIYKELLKVNDEKASQLKMEKDLNRYFIK